jgi:hypothetical protein
LFYWKNHFNKEHGLFEEVKNDVSILVLLEEPLQQHFLPSDSNNNTFAKFLQPLKLKFFTLFCPILTVFWVISAHFFFMKPLYNVPYGNRYFLTPEICLKKKDEH